MKIRYNFELKSKADKTFDPWLQEIFNLIEDNGVNDFVLRVSKEQIKRKNYYTIENTKNKTKAIISKQRDKISLEVKMKLLPDPTKYIKPPYITVHEIVATSDDNGKLEIANKILDVMDKNNPYSNQLVEKTKVYADYIEGKEDILIAGKITDVFDCEENKIIVIDNGLSFAVPIEEAEAKRAMVNKYIILDNMLKFEVMYSSEFNHYYDLV